MKKKCIILLDFHLYPLQKNNQLLNLTFHYSISRSDSPSVVDPTSSVASDRGQCAFLSASLVPASLGLSALFLPFFCLLLALLVQLYLRRLLQIYGRFQGLRRKIIEIIENNYKMVVTKIFLSSPLKSWESYSFSS